MKYFLMLLACLSLPPLAWPSSSSNGTEDIAKVPLVPGPEYDPAKNMVRDLSKAGVGAWMLVRGEKLIPNIKELLLTELNAKVLQEKYYTDASEREQIAEAIARETNWVFKNLGVDNQTTIEANRSATTALINNIIHRILKTHKIKDAKRADAWSEKILKNFQACMRASKHYPEAEACSDTFKKNVKPHIGEAVIYELARENLATSFSTPKAQETFLSARVAQYTKCYKNAKDPDEEIKNCVLASMRTGILEVTKIRIIKSALDASVPKETASLIPGRVMPSYEKCLADAADEAPIMACVNKLVANAGSEIVKESIFHNPKVKETLSNNEARLGLANSRAKIFHTCVENNVKKGIFAPNSDSQADTNNCSTIATNDATYVVVLSLLRKSAADTMGKPEAFATEAKDYLDQCWKMDQTDKEREACLRSTITRYSVFLANQKIQQEVSSQLLDENTDLLPRALDTFETCLKSNLPQSISAAKNLQQDIDGCQNKMIRTFVLKAAVDGIKTALRENLTAPEIDSFAKRLVFGPYGKNSDYSFAACLSKNDNYEQINSCNISLRINSAIEAAHIIFPKTLYSYLEKNDGMESFGITPAKATEFLTNLENQHRSCLNATKITDVKVMDQHTVNCFKSSIHTFALFLADSEFTKNVSPHYLTRTEVKNKFAKDFHGKFHSCLDTRSAERFTIKEYLDNVYICANTLSVDFTRIIGTDLVEDSINENLKIPEHKKEVRASVVNKLQKCLAEESDREVCTGSLLKEATDEIVSAAAREQARVQLASEAFPKGLVKEEEKFKSCIHELKSKEKNLDKSVDRCTQNYIIGLSTQIAQIKLYSTLSGSLGQKAFNDNKEQIDGYYKLFLTCASKKQAKAEDLLKQIAICSTQLEEKATTLVEANLKRWLASTSDSSKHTEFKAALAAAIPCLSGLVPESPYDENAVGSVNPESMLQGLSATIGNYINYDIKKAELSLPRILEKIMKDMENAGPLEARRKLVSYLTNSNVLDQLLKSIVQTKVKDLLNEPKAKEALSEKLRSKLTEKFTFEAIFTPTVLETLKPLVTQGILFPVIVDGKALSSPDVLTAQKEVEKRIAEVLLQHPRFGDTIALDAVQDNLDPGSATGLIKKTKLVVGRLFYGKSAFDWKKTRETETGKKADLFVKNCILKPQFLDEGISEDRMESRLNKAQDWIAAAIEGKTNKIPSEACD